MANPLVLPPLLLIAVLMVSAVFKLRDPSTTADAFASLRLAAWMRSSPLPRLLPYGEVVIALALLVVPAPGYLGVAIGVLLLFSAYLVVIVRALLFDEPVTCGCFGRLGLGDVDLRTGVRNALLVLLAVVTVADAAAGRSVIHRLDSFGATEWVWLLGVALAILLTVLVIDRSESGQHHSRDKAVGGVEVLEYERKPIPFGVLRDRDTGELVPLTALAATQPVLLVFVNFTCGPCLRTMDLLPRWARQHQVVRTIAVPSRDGLEEIPDLGDDVTWMEDPSATVLRTFGTVHPSAVLLGIDGLLAGGPVVDFEPISEFLDEIAEQLADAGVEPQEHLAQPSSPEAVRQRDR